jgi:hypothetical protein
MNLEARTAIEALRAGVPNRAAIRLMGTEESTIEQQFDELLQSVWTETRPGLGIAGGFGAGKSHFLMYLAEVALTQGFAVSHVVVSKETPLADPARLFEVAIRNTVLPNRTDDAVGAAFAALREAPDRLDALEEAVREAGEELAPIFSAVLYLLRRPSTAAELLRRLERFIAGGRIGTTPIRQALAAVGAGRLFDLKLPTAAVLTEQRIRFAALLLQAAGFAGWCLLLDEVELIGRYTPLQRAMAYAWLAAWLGLPENQRFPGIVAVYAITDDFVTAVIEPREDDPKLVERLRLKGRDREARAAVAAMRHIEATVQQGRLRPPGSEELVRASERLREIYRAAYDWTPPPLPPIERTATRTMRQYIKSWITQWDLHRLTGAGVAIVEEVVQANYDEDAGLAVPPSDDAGDEFA